jgi:tetratricopeptide (TPR) repeat protein
MMKTFALALLIFLPATAAAQDTGHGVHAHPVLGTVNFANSGNAAAQPAFQRGVALLHSFEYDDAIRAFQEAQRADPSLAVAYWLEALSHSRVVWGLDNVTAARAALARLGSTREARLAKAKTARERDFGAAVETFYDGPNLPVRARAFADAMIPLSQAQPADHEIATFAALASMMAWFSLPPAERGRYNDPVRDLALRVFRENPQHPGAAHYLIHFIDMNPARAADALEFARAYDRIAPDAEHALHMPSHVYLPLGMWREVAAANERAWSASRREIAEQKLSPSMSSWHALDWLQYAYLQLGRDADARALIDTAHAILRNVQLQPGESDARNAVAAAAFRYGWETGKWDRYPDGIPNIDAVLAQPRPTARAVGHATTAAYQAAVAALRARNDAAPARKVIAVFRTSADSLPADDPRRLSLQRLATQLEAMTLFASGDRERAVTLLQQLAPTEPNNASLPPTTIPSYELLGEYLLALGRHAEAAAAFEKVLEMRPNRAAALRGLARARAAP